MLGRGHDRKLNELPPSNPSSAAKPDSTPTSFPSLAQAYKHRKKSAAAAALGGAGAPREKSAAAAALGGAGAPREKSAAAAALGGEEALMKAFAAAAAPGGAEALMKAFAAALGGAGAPMKPSVAPLAVGGAGAPMKESAAAAAPGGAEDPLEPTVEKSCDKASGKVVKNELKNVYNIDDFLHRMLGRGRFFCIRFEHNAIAHVKALASGEKIDESVLRSAISDCNFVLIKDIENWKKTEKFARLLAEAKVAPQHVFISKHGGCFSCPHIEKWVLASAVPAERGVEWLYFNPFDFWDEEKTAEKEREASISGYERYLFKTHQENASRGIKEMFGEGEDRIPFKNMSSEMGNLEHNYNSELICAISAAMVNRLISERKEINAANIFASSALVNLPLADFLEEKGDKRGKIVLENIQKMLVGRNVLSRWV